MRAQIVQRTHLYVYTKFVCLFMPQCLECVGVQIYVRLFLYTQLRKCMRACVYMYICVRLTLIEK
jgi:hypothetical protein